MVTQEKLTRLNRNYYPDDLKVNRWRTIKRAFQSLLNIPIQNSEDLEYLIKKSGEGVQILFDYRNRLFIKMKSKTTILNYLKYLLFQNRIISRGMYYHNQWEHKVINSSFKQGLNSVIYGHFFKIIEHQKKMYVDQNVKQITQEEKLSNRYNLITSRLSILFEGKKKTIVELEQILSDINRKRRYDAFMAISQAYQGINEKLQNLFDQLIKIRHLIALNAGYRNYRDFAHEAKARFSYTIKDVLNFHRVIEKEVVPFLRELNEEALKAHDFDERKPWDSKIDYQSGTISYKNENELINKCVATMYDIKPEYGQHLKKMANSGLLDLFNRPKKGPGAFNIPLFEIGSSYIFTNFVKDSVKFQNISILHHEFGHALHNYFTIDEPIMAYRNFPSEISELAAMTMELFALEHLQYYYSDNMLIAQAKQQQFKRFIQIIVNRCQGDAYQHWIYTHPEHSINERRDAYIESMERFNERISWKGFEEYQHLESLKVLHFFQVPFYYIEYAFAALGALDIYRNYKKNRTEALTHYESFLKSGYNKDVHLLYQEAGTRFDFSEERVRDIINFVQQEINTPMI